LPYLYWIPVLHKTPYKQKFQKCSIKHQSILLAKISTAVKERLQMHCATVYARMWILKNSKELLESLKSPIFFVKFTVSKPMIYNTLYDHTS
jgi:hypothetical protein